MTENQSDRSADAPTAEQPAVPTHPAGPADTVDPAGALVEPKTPAPQPQAVQAPNPQAPDLQTQALQARAAETPVAHSPWAQPAYPQAQSSDYPNQPEHPAQPDAQPVAPPPAEQHGQPQYPWQQPQPMAGQGMPYSVPPAGEPGGGQPPIWAVPPAGSGDAPGGPPPQRHNRAGRAVAIGAAAVVLAVTSGAVGAAGALGLVDTGVVRVTETREAAPVVDRSSLSDIAANVQPSVVSIKTGTGEGSGVVLSEDGYILTNNHVVSGARNLTVTFSNGKNAAATVVGTDARTDLAVVKANGVSGLTAAKFGNSDDMRIGDTVLALGSPLGLEGSVTAGIVSALDRTIRAGGQDPGSRGATSISGLLQTDAAINPGNSGGALVNLNGEVIGINTAIATAGNGNGNIGVGFAIPSNRAKQVSDQLRQGEKVSHPVLGVAATEADGGGAEVTAVTAGSPAASAGIQIGDVVTKVGDRVVNDSDDLVSAIQSRKVGDRVEITYTRGGVERTTTVTLGEAS